MLHEHLGTLEVVPISLYLHGNGIFSDESIVAEGGVYTLEVVRSESPGTDLIRQLFWMPLWHCPAAGDATRGPVHPRVHSYHFVLTALPLHRVLIAGY